MPILDNREPSLIGDLIQLALSLDDRKLRECGFGTKATFTDLLRQVRNVTLAIYKDRSDRMAAFRGGCISASETPSGAHGGADGKSHANDAPTP